MKNPDSHVGTWGWAGLVAGVATWDLLAEETLSSAVDRYLEHPTGRYLAIGAVALTGAHLLNIYEHFGMEHLDPFNVAYTALEKAREIIHGKNE